MSIINNLIPHRTGSQQLNSQNISTPIGDDKFVESYPAYAFEITADIVLAVLLGIGVNKLTNVIAKHFGLHIYAKLLLQLVFIITILYIMKIDSKYLYSSWKGQTNYGIIFTAIFLAVQKNVTKFLEDIYKENNTTQKT